MSDVIVGVDPHKKSVTIEAIDGQGKKVATGRFGTDTRDYKTMLSYVRQQWPQHRWAIEGAHGVGRPLAQRLLADGETVVDVPAKLAARVRVFDTGQARKTDATDAHAIAAAALRTPDLRGLILLGAMWSAYFVPASPQRQRPKQLYVDITTPAKRRRGLIEFIDLDPDLEQIDDGQVGVLDQDEFTTHNGTWAYSHELVHAAEATCQSLVGAVSSGNRRSTALRSPGGPLKPAITCSTSPTEDGTDPARGSTANDFG